jgi:diketogulonate reductase-like aldo/keto reductase
MYGTAWKKERTAELVYQAIKAGFRGIDTAAMGKHYREDLVGEGIRKAIAEGIVKRQDLYVSPLLPLAIDLLVSLSLEKMARGKSYTP